jgi:hypothetical protein
MKRSDMLLRIVDILNSAPKSVVNSYIADCVLTGIEDLGMLPPSEKYKNQCLVCGGPYEVCKWEPEIEDRPRGTSDA